MKKIVLKDKFLTQSAPGIQRKLQKLAVEQGMTLNQLVQAATAVFYNQDLEKKKKDK